MKKNRKKVLAQKHIRNVTENKAHAFNLIIDIIGGHLRHRIYNGDDRTWREHQFDDIVSVIDDAMYKCEQSANNFNKQLNDLEKCVKKNA